MFYVKLLHRRRSRRRRRRDLGAQPISLKRTVRVVVGREHRVIDLFNWSETRDRPRRRRHFAISIDSFKAVAFSAAAWSLFRRRRSGDDARVHV